MPLSNVLCINSCISSIQFKSEFQQVFRLLIAVKTIFFYFTVVQAASFPIKCTREQRTVCLLGKTKYSSGEMEYCG